MCLKEKGNVVRVNMMHDETILFLEGEDDLRVQVGAQVAKSCSGGGKKESWHLH